MVNALTYLFADVLKSYACEKARCLAYNFRWFKGNPVRALEGPSWNLEVIPKRACRIYQRAKGGTLNGDPYPITGYNNGYIMTILRLYT